MDDFLYFLASVEKHGLEMKSAVPEETKDAPKGKKAAKVRLFCFYHV